MSSKQNKIVPLVRCLNPVLKLSFKKYLSIANSGDCFDKMAARKDILSLYPFIDGLWSRFYNRGLLPSGILRKIIELKDRFAWGKMDKNYAFKLSKDEDTKSFLSLIQECGELVCLTGDDSKVSVLCEYSCEDFVKELFCKDNIFKFRIPGQDHSNHEFVLYTTAMKGDDPDSFDMQWGPLDTDIEVNSNTLPNLHFALEREKDDEWETLPINWCGKPTCDKTREYWNWGYIKFHSESFELNDMLVGEDGGIEWKEYDECNYGFQIRLVCYEVNKD